MQIKSPESTVHWLRFAIERWATAAGLLISEAIWLSFGLAIVNTIELSAMVSIFILSIPAVVILLRWFAARRIPRTKKRRIGFAVALAFEGEIEASRIRQDFINPLRRDIYAGLTGHTFCFLEIPLHAARKIHSGADAEEMRRKCKAHFFIYGTVRKRKLEGKDCYAFHLDSIVKHAPTDLASSKKFAQEFSELWPRKVGIPDEHDMLGFEFTTEWTEIVSRYIIGIAAYISGDPAYAEGLYLDVQRRLPAIKNKNAVIYDKIRTRLPVRLLELYRTQTDICIALWEADRDPGRIGTLGEIIRKTESNGILDYGYYLAKSMHLFLAKRDVDGAIEAANNCSGKRDATWHYNLAFLYAYKGDLDTAYKEYVKASKEPEPDGMMFRIESFIAWVLEQEPNRHQMYFALGFINMKIKLDFESALTDLRRFIGACNGESFPIQVSAAKRWIAKLEARE